MCFVRITVAIDNLPPDTAEGMAANVTALCARALNQKPGVISVLVERIRPLAWTIAETSTPMGAHVDATISAGTTTREDRARFIKAVSELLTTALGILPEVTYVVVREMLPTDWGFDGRTFADRPAAR